MLVNNEIRYHGGRRRKECRNADSKNIYTNDTRAHSTLTCSLNINTGHHSRHLLGLPGSGQRGDVLLVEA